MELWWVIILVLILVSLVFCLGQIKKVPKPVQAGGGGIECTSCQVGGPSVYQLGAGEPRTPAELGLVFGEIEGEVDQGTRSGGQTGWVYHQDLVMMRDARGRSLQAPRESRRLALSSRADLGNRLFKFRLQAHQQPDSPRNLIRLKYREPIRLAFTVSGSSETQFIRADPFLRTDSEFTLFTLINHSLPESRSEIKLGDIVALARYQDGNPTGSIFLSESDNTQTTPRSGSDSDTLTLTGTIQQTPRFKLESSPGCGPLWAFGPDGRSQELKNHTEMQAEVALQTQLLQADLTKAREELAHVQTQAQAKCQQELAQQQFSRDSQAMQALQVRLEGQVKGLEGDLRRAQQQLRQAFPDDPACLAQGCGYSYRLQDQCVIGATSQSDCDRLMAQDARANNRCYSGRQLRFRDQGRGFCA